MTYHPSRTQRHSRNALSAYESEPRSTVTQWACLALGAILVFALAYSAVSSAQDQRTCMSHHDWRHHWDSPDALAAHCSLAVQAGDTAFINGTELP